MPDKSEKTFISIHEFISSWEKEVYELNNLDYFAYQLINFLGNHIEKGFLKKKKLSGYLHIEAEEIGTLAFNIGDSFESFLENNCFGDCSLACPTQFNDKVNPNDVENESNHFHVLQFVKTDPINKKQFLLTDILNYVVLDTLFDFYNYEMGLDIDDTDVGLMQFADYITSVMENFIETSGQQYLINPKESAADLFEKMIQDSDMDWEDMLDSQVDDDENDDNEGWKSGEDLREKLINEFVHQPNLITRDSVATSKVMGFLINYLSNYAGIDDIEEITFEDLEEFFTFWLLREAFMERDLSAENIRDILIKFFRWLELAKDINLNPFLNEIVARHFTGFRKALLLVRSYFDKNSLIEGVLASNDAENKVISGLFYVEAITSNGLFRIQDIYLKKSYFNVQINLSDASPEELTGMIVDGTIKPTVYGWRLVNLEYIFPEKARPYLH